MIIAGTDDTGHSGRALRRDGYGSPRGGGAPGAFPAGLVAQRRYEFDDLTSLFQLSNGTTAVTTANDPIGYVLNKGVGGAAALTQATAGNRPTYQTSHGYGAARFVTANSSYMFDTVPGLYNAGACWVAASGFLQPTVAGQALFAEGGTGSANSVYRVAALTTPADDVAFFLRNSANVTIANNLNIGVSDFAGFALSKALVFVDTGSSVTLYSNGIARASQAYTRSGTLTLDRFALGALIINSISSFFTGDVNRFAAGFGAISAGRIVQLTNWLKFGIGTLGLPQPDYLNFNNTLALGWVTLGNVLQYEYTQAWTAEVDASVSSASSTAGMFFTNVTTSTAFPGYEFWVNATGKLHVRIINDITTKYIGVIGTTVVTDGVRRRYSATYDGSGTAAGVKLYINGVLETMTVESDTLAASTIIGANQDFYIGSQKNHTDFYLHGKIYAFQLSNTVRSQAYLAAHNTSATMLNPADANTKLAYNMPANYGSLTLTDLSTSALTGTLSTQVLWE